MDNIEVYNNTIYRTALAGIWLFGSKSYPSSSANVHIHHNRIYDTGTKYNNNNIGGIISNGFNALIENNVIDGAYGAGIVQNNVYSPGPDGSGYMLTARNNIITNTRMSTAGGYGYGIYNPLAGTHSFVLQNNCFFNNTGGDYEGSQASSSDIATDPQYADRSAHNYHLKSKYGRWDESRWVNDTVNSPCIDAGYILSDYSDEPEDNGDRINIGAYGNTEYSSKSGTSSSESVAPIFTEKRITANGFDQSKPAIYTDRIVWQDARNGISNVNSDIYLYNISTSKETQITKNRYWASSPVISGDRIVWEDNCNVSSDIYMYDLFTSTETPITSNGSWQGHPSIYNNRIVWQDSRNGNSDIYIYTISASNETQITVNESRQESPAIYDGRVVWNDGRNGNSDIYMCNALSEDPEPKMPVANFSSNVTQGYASLSVQFIDTSTGTPTQWLWDFGDGADSTEQNATHTYSAAGNYTVKLTTSNGNGTALTTSTIIVLPKKTESSNGTIEWGPSVKYDTGGPNSLAMDNSGHCVETHVGTGRLFYRVGTVNFTNNTVNWE